MTLHVLDMVLTGLLLVAGLLTGMLMVGGTAVALSAMAEYVSALREKRSVRDADRKQRLEEQRWEKNCLPGQKEDP